MECMIVLVLQEQLKEILDRLSTPEASPIPSQVEEGGRKVTPKPSKPVHPKPKTRQDQAAQANQEIVQDVQDVQDVEDEDGAKTPPPIRRMIAPQKPTRSVPEVPTWSKGRHWAWTETRRIQQQRLYRIRRDAETQEREVEDALLANANDYAFYL